MLWINSRIIEPAKIPITAAINNVFTLKIAPKTTRENEIPAIIFKCFLFFRLIIETGIYSESFSTKESLSFNNSAFTNSRRSIKVTVSEILELVVNAILAPSSV